jgi:hypothetical protein
MQMFGISLPMSGERIVFRKLQLNIVCIQKDQT